VVQILRYAQDDIGNQENANLQMELLRVLATLSEPPTSESRRLAGLVGLGEPADDAEWTELFALQLPPYASIYLSADGRLGGEPRDRVAGFWRALGLEPPHEPDHLSLLLGFQAQLADREARAATSLEKARWRSARRAFLHEHLASWLPFYLGAVAEEGSRFYRRWSDLLWQALARESEAVGALGSPPAVLGDLPAIEHPRRAPGSDESGEAGEDWLSTLFAPARCGFFLPRSALRRCARELGLGERMGERRVALRTLLAQDAPATFSWLTRHAASAVETHRRAAAAMPAATAVWMERASSSTALFGELAAEAARAKDRDASASP
jgi:TorA maturation chaperone TorD